MASPATAGRVTRSRARCVEAVTPTGLSFASKKAATSVKKRSALSDVTNASDFNDSPIAGVVPEKLPLKEPSTGAATVSPPRDGEELLRKQVKALLEQAQPEALAPSLFQAPPLAEGINSPDCYKAPTPANTPASTIAEAGSPAPALPDEDGDTTARVLPFDSSPVATPIDRWQAQFGSPGRTFVNPANIFSPRPSRLRSVVIVPSPEPASPVVDISPEKIETPPTRGKRHTSMAPVHALAMRDPAESAEQSEFEQEEDYAEEDESWGQCIDGDDAEYYDEEEGEWEDEAGCDSLCSAIGGLTVAEDGQVDALRGLPRSSGTHIRFDDEGEPEEALLGKLRGVPTPVGKHTRFA